MSPRALQPSSFVSYPTEGRQLAQRYLTVLQAMPLCVLPSFLEQIRHFDEQFPQEQGVLGSKLDWLLQAGSEQRDALLAQFRQIQLSPALEQMNWVDDPERFIQALTAYLWQSQQIDAYRGAARKLFESLPAAPQPARPSLAMFVIGRDAGPSAYPLFSRLREHGLHASNVSIEGAAASLLATLGARASAAPEPYAHWYIDGGSPWSVPASAQDAVIALTYPQLSPIREAVLRAMDEAVRQGTGPELLESRLSHLAPADLGAARCSEDPRLQRFYTSLLTSGSGTQIYSTSFVQAASLAVLRRVRPSTLLVRFAPRRRQASLNDLIEARNLSAEEEPQGSLIDADMAAFYAYLELRKQAGGSGASLLVWFEGHAEAFVSGPGVTRGVSSSSALTVGQLLAMALG